MVMMLAAFQMPTAAVGKTPRPPLPNEPSLFGGPANSGGKLNTGAERNVSAKSCPSRPCGVNRVAPWVYCVPAKYRKLKVMAEPSDSFQPKPISKPGSKLPWPLRLLTFNASAFEPKCVPMGTPSDVSEAKKPRVAIG